MANYLIGLDFGTSQTKVCVFNEKTKSREFIKFENESFFLPSLITKKKSDGKLTYGDENTPGDKYRYFKMAAAEDKDFIQVTFEDLDGNLNREIDNYRKYSENVNIKSGILVVLYLAYIYLFVKNKKGNQKQQQKGGLLGRLEGRNQQEENSFSINLGIPTAWNSHEYLQRKIRFQSFLLIAIKLADKFDKIEDFLNEGFSKLKTLIIEINKENIKQVNNDNEYLKTQLEVNKLSVFPESAAGVNYLLQTKRLTDPLAPNEEKYFATLDIGAGTSDIAIFKVRNNQINEYYCSESIEIASNDVYKEYAKLSKNIEEASYEDIKQAEIEIRKNNFDENCYFKAIGTVKGNIGILAGSGIQFAVRRIFYKKFYILAHRVDQDCAFTVKNNMQESSIVIYGGGSNFPILSEGVYCYYPDPMVRINLDDKNFIAQPIKEFIKEEDIADLQNEIDTIP